MPSAAEIRTQVDFEEQRRARLSVPAFAGGFLYLLSQIIITSTLNGLPTVGPLQGLEPALGGSAKTLVSPRTNEVKYISHHASTLIAGSVLAAVALGVLTALLVFLFDATLFRRPGTWAPARSLVLVGGITVAVAGIAHQVVYAIGTHEFALSSNHSISAVEHALTKGTANELVAYLSLLAGLALVVGMIVVMLNAQRVGLVPRWMGFLGMLSALLILLPNVGATLELVPAFWLVMMGLLMAKRWPGQPPRGGDPPAWKAGEARPWPTRAQMQGGRAGRGAPAAAMASAADAPPEPVRPAGSSRKRRRKRGGGR
jgi:hypothetical protein